MKGVILSLTPYASSTTLPFWSPEFFRRDLWFQSRPSVCPFVRNAFSPSLMSQIFWNLVYSLWGKKPFFIFAKFGPGGPKNDHFWPFFGHLCSFFLFKNFFRVRIFFDFLILCFWAYLKVICKKLWIKGQNSALQGQKTAIFGPFCQLSQFFKL